VSDGAIIVTARRRDEEIQDVPMVVEALTAQDLSKLNIREFTDIQSLVPVDVRRRTGRSSERPTASAASYAAGAANDHRLTPASANLPKLFIY